MEEGRDRRKGRLAGLSMCMLIVIDLMTVFPVMSSTRLASCVRVCVCVCVCVCDMTHMPLCVAVLEISVFSMVSKAISRYIVNHISTQTWRNRMILQKLRHCSSPSSPPPKEDPTTLGHYKALGR